MDDEEKEQRRIQRIRRRRSGGRGGIGKQQRGATWAGAIRTMTTELLPPIFVSSGGVV